MSTKETETVSVEKEDCVTKAVKRPIENDSKDAVEKEDCVTKAVKRPIENDNKDAVEKEDCVTKAVKRPIENDNKDAVEKEDCVTKAVKRPIENDNKDAAIVPRLDDQASPEEHGNLVAAHYNSLEEKGRKERFNSPIFYMRNFNNWVKSVLIQEYTDKIREKDYGRALRVLDICCGKGGDLSKWQKARVDRTVFADIAAVSVEQCKARYEELQRKCNRIFSAEFIAADCSKETLRDKYSDPSIKFDVVSCQFGLHYSFESYGQARRMLTNISECLRPDGYFFGTIPDAYEIISRAKKSPDGKFGNRIYNIQLLFDPKEGYPLFGAKYDFHLEGVVDCPEFLVNFELFVKLAAEFGLELVYKARFEDFFKDHSKKYKQLLNRIMCFESYPAPPGKELIGEDSEYEHAKKFLETAEQKNWNDCIGTMSTCEWEVATVYMAFAFKKCKSTLDLNGKPVYETSSKEASK